MGDDRGRVGRQGEAIACAVLKKHGYKILEKNYRSRLGEIDIIAQDGDSLVFVEVKTRRTQGFGSPKRGVTPIKQRKLSMAALEYLKKTQQITKKARFDVVAIHLSSNYPEESVIWRLRPGAHVEIIKNAFDLAY